MDSPKTQLVDVNGLGKNPYEKPYIESNRYYPFTLFHQRGHADTGHLFPEGIGRIEVFPEYKEGLKDIEAFSHLIIFYRFDRAGEIKLIRTTFLDDEPHGVFTSRHPCRPNGIGITIVKFLKRTDHVLEVSGIDVLDGTPLIDIKPYIPRFDCFPEASEGWVASKKERPKPKGRE